MKGVKKHCRICDQEMIGRSRVQNGIFYASYERK